MTPLLSAALPRTPSSARRARELLGGALAAAGRGAAPGVNLAELLVSELATNAIRYGGGDDFGYTLGLEGDRLRVEVRDANRARPQVRHAGPADEGGRGMELVSTLSADWGIADLDGGKVVWFELDLPGPP